MSIPRADLEPNTAAFENLPLVAPTGFREYDARWLYPSQINLLGVRALGEGLGTQLHEMGVEPKIVVGHDFREYSQAIKQALILGLMNAGCEVLDIGLALSPVAYFAQFALDAPAVAMVTASHNENGWTGVKIGAERPLTHGPDEMARLRDIVLGGEAVLRGGGRVASVPDFAARYLDDVSAGPPLPRPLKVVAACGNGTAGAFAPQALERIGAEVIPLHCELDWSFPHHNPNPEDMGMLRAIADKVRETGADIGLAFDGDGDRCGVVDDKGEEIFADKVGVLLARDLAAGAEDPLFVVDVKSTGLYLTDPELKRLRARTDYWKTGHSYIKRRVKALGALAGIEKSGHYFLNPPVGRGYDDGVLTAVTILRALARTGGTMAQWRASLPESWASPTMAPHCADEVKYDVVARASAALEAWRAQGRPFAGSTIADIVTVNGARAQLASGAWGLIRASSNKPSLVIVVESPNSEDEMRAVFAEIETLLAGYPEVGAYDQKI